MSPTALALVQGAVTAEADEGFTPPGIGDFVYPPIFENVAWLDWLTKPMVASVLSAVIIFVFFYVGARKKALVPGTLPVRRSKASTPSSATAWPATSSATTS